MSISGCAVSCPSTAKPTASRAGSSSWSALLAWSDVSSAASDSVAPASSGARAAGAVAGGCAGGAVSGAGRGRAGGSSAGPAGAVSGTGPAGLGDPGGAVNGGAAGSGSMSGGPQTRDRRKGQINQTRSGGGGRFLSPCVGLRRRSSGENGPFLDTDDPATPSARMTVSATSRAASAGRP